MRSRWYNILVLLSLVLGLVPVTAAQAASETAPMAQPAVQETPGIEVEPALLNQLATDEATGYLIYFEEKPDLSSAYEMDWIKRGRFVANALSQAALRSQANVRAYLDKQGVKYKTFWIENVISVESSNRATFNGLFAFSEIGALRQHRQLGLIEPEEVTEPLAPQSIEPNIMHVLADQVWAEGYTGEGIVVASVDTGVRYTHDALVNHYRGNLGGGTFDHNYNWWDPYGDHPTEPGDDNGHGSHTMGTMVGDDGGANQIGMAPGAQWMACRGCNTSSCTDVALLECAEFFAAPWDLTQANANPDKRPNAINNSWGDCETSYDDWYQDVVDAWHAMGIYPIFSNGNASNCSYPAPPGLNTVGNPARYGNVTGVGSTGRDNGQYATHSNWGPTDNPDTVNPHPGWADLKPQVLAPGVNIRSSVNTGDSAYQGGWNGTSMSAPHVTGLIALMWSAAPCLIGDYATTETIIEDTATPIAYDDGTGGGAHVPNYAAGWGEINALAAVQAAVGECGDSAIVGQVTDTTTSAPVAGATVWATSVTAQRKTASDADGLYALTVFSDTYTLTASRYGYRTTVIPDVVATTGATTTQNIALTPAQMYEVSGQVTDAATGWPLYAHISITGDPFDPVAPDNSVWTDPTTGEYSIMLAEGITYTFEVEAWVDGYNTTEREVGPLTSDQSENFALDATPSCTAPGYYFTDGVFQAFEGAFPPAGWTVVNNGGNCEWVGNDPGGRGNLTGGTGAFAVADSDNCGIGTTMNTDLFSPIIDVSGLMSVTLEFSYDYYNLSSAELAAVDVSPDGGITWLNVVTWNSSQRGPARFSADVTSLLGGATAAQVRFRYVVPGWDWWWEVDDFMLGYPVCMPPGDGGLVVGNAYDANLGQPLTGAAVVSDMGDTTTAAFTPDPAVDDAFYTLFSPSGAHTFIASNDGFLDDVAMVNVVDGDTVAQDFFLDAGYLTATPDGFDVTLEAGANLKQWLSLENIGALDAQYTLIEVPGGFIPNGPLAAMALPSPDSERRFELALGDTSAQSLTAEPWNPDGVVELIVDDGSAEDAIGLTAGGQFVWLNRFTPDPSEYPFTLDQVWMLFRDSANLGEAMELVIWEDTDGDGDPGTGATFRSAEYVTVQANDNTTWSVYNLSSPVFFAGPGDVLIGAVNRDATGTHPASIDTTASQGRSWVGIYSGNPPEPPTLPPDGDWGTIDLMGFPGNWMIRGSGVTGTGGADAIPWLSEVPVSGTVATGASENVMLTFDAGVPEANQPGTYYGSLKVKTDTPYPDATVPVTLNVTAPATWGKIVGTVSSLGYCDLESNPLGEAEVTITSNSGAVWTLLTGADGGYSLWLDAMYGPVTITASFDEHAMAVVTDVEVTSGVTTTADLNLRWLEPCMSAEPSPLEWTVELGYSDTVPFTMTNVGAAGTGFALVEANGGFTIMTPLAATTVPTIVGTSNPAWAESGEAVGEPVIGAPAGGAAPEDIGMAWETMAPVPSARVFNAVIADTNGYVYVIGGTSDAGGLAPTNTTFRYNTATDSWDTMATMPAALDSIDGAVINGKIYIPGDATTANTFVYDIATNTWSTLSTTGSYTARSQYQVVAIGTDLYVLGGIVASASASTTEVWILDTTSGAWTAGVPMQKSRTSFSAGAIDGEIYVAGGVLFPGFTPDMTSEKFDGMSWSYIANVPNGGGAYTRWSYNADGLGADGLWLAAGRRDVDWLVLNHAGYYDPDTDTWTDSPTIPTLAQGRVYMEGDVASDGYFYVIGGRDSAGATAYATNERLEVGYAGGGGGGGAIPWLFEDPESGMVDADSTFPVDVTFDASAAVTQVTQPGEYFGTLYVTSDDPYAASIAVPVTMTVTPPATWGKLMGTVTGLGYCDADPAPLEGADVLIEAGDGTTWTLMTDDMGVYAVWMDQMYSPVTVTVSVPDHEKGEASGVGVAGGVTTTQDFNLRWLVPCVNTEPVDAHATLELGATATEALTLTNVGATDTDWDFEEENLGALTGTEPGVSAVVLLSEDFEGVTTPALPTDWQLTQVAGTPVWQTHAGTVHPSGQPAHSGTNLVYFNSWTASSGSSARLWYSQTLSGMTTLTFWMYHDTGYTSADRVQVQVSVDGGTTWTDVGSPVNRYDGTTGWSQATVDLSAYATAPAALIGFLGISAYGNDVHIDDIAVSSVSTDPVIWLAETPAFGNLAADTGVQAVNVDFDASVVDQPGEYYANLKVNSDDPMSPVILPVTMTVTAPAGWARLDGTVSSLGYCDAEMNPLEGVEVTIENGGVVTLTTGADGMYGYWLAPGTYTVTASAAEHTVAEVVVTISAGVSQTQDFDLRWLKPCVTATPDAIDDTLAMGETSDHPLTILNNGAGDTNFGFTEWYEGYVLPPVMVASEPAARMRLMTIGDNALTTNSNATGEVGVAALAPARPEGIYALTHSLSQDVLSGNSVSCNASDLHADNSYIRVFDLTAFGITEYFDVQTVEVGIETAVAGSGGVQPGVVNLYTLSGPLEWANMTLIGSANVDVADQDLTIISVPVTATAPAGSVLVVEFFTPDGQGDGNSLYVGSNNLGQTAPTYLAATACGIAEPTDVSVIGFPDMHLVMNVIGYTPENVDLPWLSEDPLTGVTLGDDTAAVTVTLDAGQVPMPGVYYATLGVESDDPVNPRYSVAVAMTVTLPATYGKIEGTVYGTGYCDGEMLPLANADVVIEGSDGMTITVSTDVGGLYEVWRDEATGPYTITAMAPDHWNGMATGVIVTGTETTVQDLELRWMKPCVGVAPVELTAEVSLGMSVTTYMTVTNAGGYDLNWSLDEGEAGFTPMASAAAGHILVVNDDGSNTAATTAFETALTTLGYTWDEVTSATFVGMDVATIIATYDGVIYAGVPSSGSEQTQCIAYLDAGGRFLVADNDFGYYYGDGSYPLYTTYFEAFLVSDSGSGGVLTGVDIMAGENPDIGSDPYPDDFTIIGPDAVGIFEAPSSNWAGLRIERLDYKAIYFAWDYQYTSTPLVVLEKAMKWLVKADVPWLFEDPEDGMTAMDSTSTVSVTFDAGVPEVTQPGEYYTTLTVESDDPMYEEVAIPVTMTVLPPATWGKLGGTVTGLGYCDVNPMPIEDAVVFIESGTGMSWTVTTDVSGTYAAWFDEMYSPVTVTVSYEAGYEAQTFTDVVVVSGTMTTLDANLRWLQPCVSTSDTTVEVTVPWGATNEVTLTLFNNGAVDSSFILQEVDLGSTIAGSQAVADAFGYAVADSNDAFGPAYDFVDISAFGTAIALGDDDFAGPVPIGFDFPFYGASAVAPNVYDQIFVNSNGFLSFGAGSTDLSNDVLPDILTPNNIIALMWDDLVGGTAYVYTFDSCPYANNECLVVQYEGFTHIDGQAAGSWQAVLFRNGNVLIQFADAGAYAGAGSTTGIENEFGTDGITYAANAPVLEDDLAVCFAYPGNSTTCVTDDAPWLDESVNFGDIMADGSTPVTLSFDAGVPEVTGPGTYMAGLYLFSEDPINGTQFVPVTMTVERPATWGKIDGTVIGWNYCDVAAFEVEGATVFIESVNGVDTWALTTDVSGTYGLWLDEAHSPVTVTVMHDGYVTQVESVTFAAGDTPTEVLHELRMDAPCFVMDTHTIEFTLTKGHTHTEEIMMTNLGAGMLMIDDVVGDGWMTPDMTSGMLYPDESHPMDIVFSAVGMSIGQHVGELVIMNNDPMYPMMTVPVTMTVVTPTVAVDVFATPPSVTHPGDLITYTIVLTNTSDGPVDVVLTDMIPANTTYVDGSVTGGLSYVQPTTGDDYVMWSGTLSQPSPDTLYFSRTFTFVVRVNDDVSGGTIDNTVEAETEDALFTDTVSVLVEFYRIFLPLTLRSY